MDLETGAADDHEGGGSSDEQEASNSRRGRKAYHRHTSRQIQQLETFFKECPHPDENQRRQLSREIGLEPKQIKFWFQNKRTQTKAQTERADNSILRAENERIQCENVAIREALKNVICPACGGPPFGEEERQRSLQKLQLENAQLKEEHEKVSNLLAKYIGKPISQVDSVMPMIHGPPSADLLELNNNPGILDSSSKNMMSDDHYLSVKGFNDMEKALMCETAMSAMDELIRLLRMDEPLWTKSHSDRARYIIDRDSYEKIFPRASHFKSSSARFESSKDSGIVAMSGINLVDMFLDSNKWVDLFATIVTRAKTIQVLETGNMANRSGTLQLMYEQMHILSPLVPPREFYFLRHCQQIEIGIWVIVDVSFDCCFKQIISPARAWRLPSGCIIQDLPNGCSKVAWVEHVEVDDKTRTHRLYRELICGGTAYGAERFIVTLQRMCERLAFSKTETAPILDIGGAITPQEGRSSIMKLSHRMVKNFCRILSMSGKLDFPQLSEVHNSGVRVSVSKSTEVGQPAGMIVSAATSLWLPLSPQQVFDFFKDDKKRVQWDILSNGHPVREIAHIANGAHSGNCISIIRPFIPTENNMVMLQECCIDPLGSLIVYAPLDIPAMNAALSGEDSSTIPILPSGFGISGDGRTDNTGTASASASTSARSSSAGSLLTVAFQILVASTASSSCSSSSASSAASKELNMESVATVNTLISSTVQKIKAALDCSSLD